MAGMSAYLETAVLNWFRGTAFPAAPTVYAALFNGDPTDAGTGGVETTTNVRAAGRPTVTLGAPVAGPPRTSSNTAIVDFGNAAQAATFSHYALFDASAGGNMLNSAALNGGAQTVTAGTAVRFAIGGLVNSAD
jgi:hypothetical protein